MQTESLGESEYIIPDVSVLDGPEDEIVFDDDDLLREHSDNLSTNKAEGDMPISGIVQTYFLELKEHLTREIALHKMPVCYQQGHFWIHPIEPYFAMCEANLSPDGLTPYSLYQSTIYCKTQFLCVRIKNAHITSSP